MALMLLGFSSPTDPVAVLGVLKQAKAPKSLETKIAGDSWVATSPNCPELKAEGPTESDALNGLVAAIREAIGEAGDKGITWKTDAKPAKDKDTISRQVTGCWPPIIKDEPSAKPAKRKEVSDGA